MGYLLRFAINYVCGSCYWYKQKDDVLFFWQHSQKPNAGGSLQFFHVVVIAPGSLGKNDSPNDYRVF
jgi:hypothetical protein